MCEDKREDSLKGASDSSLRRGASRLVRLFIEIPLSAARRTVSQYACYGTSATDASLMRVGRALAGYMGFPQL